MTEFTGGRIRLAEGSYYLNVEHADTAVLYPIPIISSLPGPDADGMFNITIRPLPARPPRLLPSLPEFGYIPSGHFLFGDRLNPLEPQYVWLTGYFISPFEVTNAEYREFSRDPNGYGDDDNWTEAGRKWKAKSSSHVRFQDRRTAFALNPWLLNRIERHRHSFISYS
jgi:formylglycine-generating enzyme required for sulfatase activity